MEMFDKFFDCLNASNYSVGKQQRNPLKNPYYSAEDFRLMVYPYELINVAICMHVIVARDEHAGLFKKLGT